MIVTLLGKEHVSGISKKTGKEFSANVVHVAYQKKGVDGLAVDSIFLNEGDFPLSRLIPNKKYNVDRDSRGFLVDFALVSE